MIEIEEAIKKAIDVQKELALNGFQVEAIKMQKVINRLKTINAFIEFICDDDV